MSMLTTIQSYPLKPQLLPSLSPHVFKTPGLSMPAAWYKPQEPGMVRCPATAAPPPEPPKIMTFPGSPPKLRMFSCTHRNASTCHAVPLSEATNRQCAVETDSSLIHHYKTYDFICHRNRSKNIILDMSNSTKKIDELVMNHTLAALPPWRQPCPSTPPILHPIRYPA